MWELGAKGLKRRRKLIGAVRAFLRAFIGEIGSEGEPKAVPCVRCLLSERRAEQWAGGRK